MARTRSRGHSLPAPAETEPEPSDDSSDDGQEPSLLDELQRRIGVRFRNPALLRLALTHRSVVQDAIAAGIAPGDAARYTNERLEFLGDAVLGAVAAEFLYDRDSGADEGTLTRQRVALVRAETLVQWARELDLGDYLYLGPGERPSDSSRDRMLAGAFEAVVGAISVDRGHGASRRFLTRLMRRDVDDILGRPETESNPKGRLQEVLQERFRVGPTYRTIDTEGPAHAQLFTVEAAIGSRRLGVGKGASKREAQQAAAADALANLDGYGTAVAGLPDSSDGDSG